MLRLKLKDALAMDEAMLFFRPQEKAILMLQITTRLWSQRPLEDDSLPRQCAARRDIGRP